MATPEMDGARKAAVLMVLLGEDTSSKILQHIDEPDVLRIGREVAALRQIDPKTATSVLEEYRERIMNHREAESGGPDAARRIVRGALSPERAALLGDVLSRFEGAPGTSAGASGSSASDGSAEASLAALGSVNDQDLARILELEHPQTAALVLMHLDAGRAAGVLGAMGEETQAGVTARLARLSSVQSDVAQEVFEALSSRFESVKPAGLEERDALGAAAEVLKRMDRARSRTILSRLEAVDIETAEKLRSRVYTFEMLLLLPDRGVQEILKGVDSKQLGLSLKGAVAEVAEKFFKNMSTRAAEMVKDEMEFLGVAKVKDVEQAQKEILDKALRLEEEGVITFDAPQD
jgi:flagellar motor switch protein FliG